MTFPVTASGASDDGSVKVLTWAGIGNADTGVPVSIPKFADKTVTITGTFAAATVVLQGTNDPATEWLPLTDPQGNAISKSAAAMEAVTENPLWIRPAVTGGSGETNITVIIVARLSNNLRT